MAKARGSERKAPRKWGEREAIRVLQRVLERQTPDARVKTGIGDDAAVLTAGAAPLVWTVDVCVEDVHFRRDWLSLEDVGWRSFQAALSDLAAMGARPVAALSSLVVPEALGRRQIEALGTGQAKAARALGCPVVGGNISKGDQLSVTTSAIGEAARPRGRQGARPGHELWLVGDVGLAGAGLRLLAETKPEGREAARAERNCIDAWRRPNALIELGIELAQGASSMIDISDGLAGDARRLAEASGVRIVIDEARLAQALRPELTRVSAMFDVAPLELALYGGEDYALLATGQTKKRPSFATPIGKVLGGHGAVLSPSAGGKLTPLKDAFDHLSG